VPYGLKNTLSPVYSFSTFPLFSCVQPAIHVMKKY